MKRENKMFVVTAVSLMAALAGVVSYNLGFFFGKAETERRRCAVS